MDEIVDPQEHAAHGESGRGVHVDDLTDNCAIEH